MNDSLREVEQKKKKSGRLTIVLSLLAIVFLTGIVVGGILFLRKQNETIQQGNSTQDVNHQSGPSFNHGVDSSIFDKFEEEESTELEWVIEGEPVDKELLYGYYLPVHCSGTEIANVDVVNNRFEEKEWSQYISSTGDTLTLSALPLLWDACDVDLNLISEENMNTLEAKTGYLHGLAGMRSYEKMIRDLYPEYGFTTVTYYDERRNMYTIDCAYTVSGNDMTLVLIQYDKEEREYTLIPIEQYQVIREKNEITIYKDKNFVKYVPYNLCEKASFLEIEAFAKYQKDRYEDIKGIVYYNSNPDAESWPLYGCVYFSDGTKAPEAEFDFSKENQVSIRWNRKVTDYFGSIVELEGSGEVTFSYTMIQDTGLILEKDGVEYRYLQSIDD